MPSSNSTMLYKLQVALNSKGLRILCNRSQFYSDQQNRPVTMYKISQSVTNYQTGRNTHVELFSTASEIQVVLFLRNLWYAVQGKEIPPTNQIKGAEFFQRAWDEFAESSLEKVLSVGDTLP